MNVSASVLAYGSAIHSFVWSFPIKNIYSVLTSSMFWSGYCAHDILVNPFMASKVIGPKWNSVVITLSLPDMLPASFTLVLKAMLEFQCLRLKTWCHLWFLRLCSSRLPCALSHTTGLWLQLSLQTCVLLPAIHLAYGPYLFILKVSCILLPRTSFYINLL